MYFEIERLNVCVYLHSLYGLNNKRNRARVYLINNLKFHWSFMHCLLFFVASNLDFISKKKFSEKMFQKKWFSSNNLCISYSNKSAQVNNIWGIISYLSKYLHYYLFTTWDIYTTKKVICQGNGNGDYRSCIIRRFGFNSSSISLLISLFQQLHFVCNLNMAQHGYNYINRNL